MRKCFPLARINSLGSRISSALNFQPLLALRETGEPLGIVYLAFAIHTAAETSRKGKYLLVALQGFIDQFDRLACLLTIFINGEEGVSELVDVHEDVVDHNLELPTIVPSRAA